MPVSCLRDSRLSRKGLIAYASSTDCIGPIASSVADCAALLGAVAGEDRGGDSTALQQPVPDYAALLKEVNSRAAPLMRRLTKLIMWCCMLVSLSLSLCAFVRDAREVRGGGDGEGLFCWVVWGSFDCWRRVFCREG